MLLSHGWLHEAHTQARTQEHAQSPFSGTNTGASYQFIHKDANTASLQRNQDKSNGLAERGREQCF